MTTITIQNVSKRYHTNQKHQSPIIAVDNISLEIGSSETIAILGPSGSGKTTLLRMIAGLEKPDSGHVLYDGVPIHEIPNRVRGIGMVFQDYALIPHWIARDNVSFFLRLRKREQEVPDRVKDVSKITGYGLNKLMGRLPRQLSGGEKQKIAIARAFARDLEVLLLDEPFAHLDAQFRATARVELNRLLFHFPITMVYVTHDQLEATSVADWIVLLKNGQIVQIGTYEELYENPINLFVAQFIGNHQLNVFRGTAQNGAWQGEIFDGHPMPTFSEDSDHIIMGIRPEHFSLADDGIPAQVDFITPYFAEGYQMADVRQGNARWTIQVPQEVSISIGDAIFCQIDPEQALYFASSTGQRIETIASVK